MGMWIAIAFLVSLMLIALIAVGIYNGLVSRRNRYKNAFAQIDVQLKRRYDLIPNLVEIARGYLKHERETLEAVIRARNTAVLASETAARLPGDANAMSALASAEGQLTSGLGRLMVVAESYPALKADVQMRELTEELTSTENKVAFARQAYNDSVTEYNNARESFPGVLFAGPLKFMPASLLVAIEAPEERNAPKIAF